MKVKKAKLEWYAFRYDWNKHKLVFINVLKDMEEDIAKKVRKGNKDNYRPVIDYNSFKDYIKGELMYYYWCKSEHEVLISDFSKDIDNTEKHDIWWQLEPNLDRICEYIIREMQLNLS